MTREEAIAYGKRVVDLGLNDETQAFCELAIKSLEQEPTSFQWCTTCKEYDQEKHCCHRWSKVIRNTVEEMKQEQEPILDKIRAEIEEIIGEHNLNDYDFCSGLICARKIIDKYKAQSAHDVAQEIVKNNVVVDL